VLVSTAKNYREEYGSKEMLSRHVKFGKSNFLKILPLPVLVRGSGEYKA
jgi:hypothetical protein